MAAEIVQVKNAQGVVLSELDIGWDSRIQLNLTSLWEGIAALSGTIRHNGAVVANLSKATDDKVAVVWVGNTGGVLSVNNGDTIQVQFTTPEVYSYTIPVKRIQPDWGESVNLAFIISVLVKAGLKGRTLNEILNDGINKINAGFVTPIYEYSNNTALNVKRLKDFFDDASTLSLKA